MPPPSLLIGTLAPLLGHRMVQAPFPFPLGEGSTLPVHDQRALQQHINCLFAQDQAWGISPYLEARPQLLAPFPQMANEQRFYHLGIDVIAPAGTPLFSPLDGIVLLTGYEEGAGNYGGYTVMAYADDAHVPFFTLFGHLDIAHLPALHAEITRGMPFARMGDHTCNGGWFAHTHVQILTHRALTEGWLHRGYCSEAQLLTMDVLCPDPSPLLGMHPVPAARGRSDCAAG